MLTQLQGQIERITYVNQENGFTIAKVRVRGRRQLATVVGNLASPTPGEVLSMRGEWVKHPRFGEQFKVSHFESQAPSSIYGIQKYLGSGLIRGIGPVMAKRIVEKFGKDTLDMIENKPEKLSQVPGVGKKRIEMIKVAWEEQRDIREVMLFLQSQGVSSGYATKIFKQYGSQSVTVVQENPYRLALDIFGIGFIIADSIAEKLGFSKDSELRAEAGILYVLNKLTEDGHIFYPYESLLEKCQSILDANRKVIVKAFASVVEEKRIVIEDVNQEGAEFKPNQKEVYPANLHHCEVGIAHNLKVLTSTAKSIRKIDIRKAIDWVQEQLAITLAGRQIQAVSSALEDKVMVITGGPGTGKTTIINAILKIFEKLPVHILLAAPTGRAAKRMREATGHQAKTIHRMLKYSVQKGGFQKNENNPLKCDLLIVDEASMIDSVLMHHILKAVPPQATFVMVGDINQLPSVGPGNVLKDIIASGAVPVVELTEIFRQAQESSIVVNAHRINRGLLPKLEPAVQQLEDFYLLEQEDPEEVLRIVLELIKERIPKRFGLDPLNDIQVLTPMHRGTVGSENLNLELQNALNPRPDGITRGGRSFRVNDKVMQTKNNYEKGIFNGDIGRITRINPESQQTHIYFDNREVLCEHSELDEIVLAYAISVHKSQGSEYPAVVIPILMQHYLLLQRNLIYTAITRAKTLVVMVGTKKALSTGIKNDKTRKRYTSLQRRLAG
ncbi:MAG: ATP-dependent RecD-like DNA helicase [Acidobacteriota bacterium]|nr:ATP-dependent RecD-like DNA helicase [Acidobacteriota bacterium]